jgi:hypothetical protein
VARGAPGGDDRAEVLRVQSPGLPFGERGGRSRLDPDPGFAVGAVEDVGAVPGRGHPGAHDRLRRGQPHRAPRDVLADHVPVLRGGEVARGAHPVQRRGAVGGGVGEVVLFGHVATVRLRGVRELRVGHERALAVVFAFLIDQAQHRGAHLFDVAGGGRQVGVGAGGRSGGSRQHRHSRDRARAQAGRAGRQRRDGQACHVRGIGSWAPAPERWAEVWTPLLLQRQHAPQDLTQVSAGGGRAPLPTSPYCGPSAQRANTRPKISRKSQREGGRPPSRPPPIADRRLRGPTRAPRSHA